MNKVKTQTECMAHIYLTFDFGTDEEKVQQARHKLDNWKLAMRLDKKLTYKFDRAEADGETLPAGDESKEKDLQEKKGKTAKPAKGKASAKAEKASKESGKDAEPAAPTKLYLRLAFSSHEKLTEQRWVDRIPGEEPFKGAAPQTVRQGQPEFEEIAGKFEDLD